MAEILKHMRFLDFVPRRRGRRAANRPAKARLRSPSDRSPRIPAASAVLCTRRATCLSVSRSDETPAFFLAIGREQRAMTRSRPRRIQVLQQDDNSAGLGARAATDFDLAPAGFAFDGQQQAAFVWRPKIWSAVLFDCSAARRGRSCWRSTPRRPVKISIQPVPSSDSFRTAIGARRFPSGAGRRRSRSPRSPCRAGPSNHCRRRRRAWRAECLGEDRLFLDGRWAMGAWNASQHGADVPIARVQRFAELAIAPANPREPPLQRRDGNRLPSAPAVDAGGEIETRPFADSGAGGQNPGGAARRKIVANRHRKRAGCFRNARCGSNRALFRRAPRDAARRSAPRRARRVPAPSSDIEKTPFLPTWALGSLTNSYSVSRIPIQPVSRLRRTESHNGAPK